MVIDNESGKLELFFDEERYDEDFEKYREKKDRDVIRKELDEIKVNVLKKELYYYNEGGSVKLSNSFMGAAYINNDNEYGVDIIVFEEHDEQEIEKVFLSELNENRYYLDEYFSEKLKKEDQGEGESGEEVTCKIAINETISLMGSQLSSKEIYNSVRVSANKVYYIDYEEGEEYGKLMSVVFDKNGKLGTPSEIDRNVEKIAYHDDSFKGDKVYYFKEIEGVLGILYCSGEKVSTDVITYYSIQDIPENTGITYATDYNPHTGLYTLNLYSRGKNTKIAYDVYKHDAISGDEILFLTDYNSEKELGNLKLYSRKKEIKVIEEASDFILLKN